MSIICKTYHSTQDFTYNKDTKCFVAEASDMQRMHDSQVFDDACDVGFVLISHKTGNSVLFIQQGLDQIDDEIIGWHYKACYKNGTKPGMWVKITKPEFSALVIND